MAGLANTIEAILYLKAKPLSIGEIAEYASCDRDAAEEGLIELMGDYAHREGALEIAETEEGYSLQLKPPYRPLLDQLIPLDIGVGALRTLAAIALRGPITQPDLVELRGSGVYQHVPDLVDQGFVRKRRQSDGRSFWLQVTEKFYQRFEIDKLPEISVPKSFAGRNTEPGEEEEPNETGTQESQENQETETALETTVSEEAGSETTEANDTPASPVSEEPEPASQSVNEPPAPSDKINDSESLNTDKATSKQVISQEVDQEQASLPPENSPTETTISPKTSSSRQETVTPAPPTDSAENTLDHAQVQPKEDRITALENEENISEKNISSEASPVSHEANLGNTEADSQNSGEI